MSLWFMERFFANAIHSFEHLWKDISGQNKFVIEVSFYKAAFYHFLTFAVILHYSARALVANKFIISDKEDQCTGGKAEILNQL